MEKLDQLVLTTLADRCSHRIVFNMMQEMRRRQQSNMNGQTERLKAVTKRTRHFKQSSERLFEAVEKGFLPMDEMLQQRSHKLQTRRQDILLEIMI